MPAARPAAALAAALAVTLSCAAAPRPTLTVRREAREVEFAATVNRGGFDASLMMPGYHAIVWGPGRAGDAALLRAEVSDTAVLDALESLGAKGGNNLPMETWEERRDRDHPAPQKVVAGPVVEVFLRLPGKRELVPFASVLADSGGRGVEMRLGGHRANIPKWKSGCIACLYSCPGGKMSNARYTVRDYTDNKKRFRVAEGTLPADGTRIGVVLRLK